MAAPPDSGKRGRDRPDTIRVEVTAALPDFQVVIPVELQAGATIRDALEKSGVRDRLPGLEPDEQRLGVFGKLRPAGHVLRDGDRVEIYRPLKADPKEVRRRLAELDREQENKT